MANPRRTKTNHLKRNNTEIPTELKKIGFHLFEFGNQTQTKIRGNKILLKTIKTPFMFTNL